MNVATVFSRAIAGVDAPLIIVEVHLSNGLPGLSIVGMPETAVKESKDRVRSALLNSHFEFPQRRITINLAPADLPKEGGRFDLPIALGILAASAQIPAGSLETTEFIGELGLTGELRPIHGVLPTSLAATKANRELILPHSCAHEATLVKNNGVRGAKHLLEVCAHLSGQKLLPPSEQSTNESEQIYADMNEVFGQHHAKRAMEIAAAGFHNLLMSGPPGTGKTMLASRLPGILPPMTDSHALETAAIASISHQGFSPKKWRIRPCRHPHHTASAISLVGGGSHPKPGEISLAHNGVLFLDEIPEFDRKVLEVLREPMETGRVTISRSKMQIEYPARFQLIAAMNPCPCGYAGDAGGRCRCTPDQIHRYRNRLSGPLLDRIDMHIEVTPIPKEELLADHNPDSESSIQIRERVIAAYTIQMDRDGKVNSQYTSRDIKQRCPLSSGNRELLYHAIEQLNLSARSAHRILKLSRTIADLDSSDSVATEHLAEAIALRRGGVFSS